MNAQSINYAFAGVVLGVVVILVVPLPPVLLDALLAFDILGSGIVLLTSITVKDPLEFSAFAPALLIATLFRLALDVSATRLILTQGNREDGVGALIPAFGRLVVHGNLVVGIIVFAILIAIQFLVIATGSQRVAEVAARFTLDAMPGKQMAIDADVHAGALDAEGARRKRALVQKEADFYGAMDGAGKFVKGDAIAALVIVALNLAGGVVVGVAYDALSPLDAIQTFAILSIGNALLTTLPAFLLSTSMGLMVTRVAADGSLGADLALQILERPDVLRTAGGFSLVLALVPALPQGLFALFGAALVALSAFAERRRRLAREVAHAAREAAKRAAIRRPETALGLVGVDALAIDVGAELGMLIPGVRLRDDLARDPATYAIRVREKVAGEGRLRLDRLLAVGDEATVARLEGELVREPVYGMQARWIESSARATCEETGALVFDPVSILGSHLAEIARNHASELLGRQELHTLVEHLRASVPSLVKEIAPDGVPLAIVQRVFEGLLRERVWPRDSVATLEALIDAASHTRDPRELVEAVRRTIVPSQLQRAGRAVLEPLIVTPDYERELSAWLEGGALAPRPETALALRATIAAYASRASGERGAIVCGAHLRPALAEFVRRFNLGVDVLAYAEIPPEMELRPAGALDGRTPARAPQPVLRNTNQTTSSPG